MAGVEGYEPIENPRATVLAVDGRAKVLAEIKNYWPKLRFLLSAIMLVLIIPHIRLSTILPQGKAAIKLLLFATLIALVGILLSILRWQRVLAALGVKRSPLSLVKMYFAALFVSNFLPSTIGGDVARASWLSLQIPGDGDAVASVVLERFSGWLVLPLITLAGLVINPHLLRLGSATRLAVVLALVTLLAMFGCVLFAFWAGPKEGGSRFKVRMYIESIRLGLVRVVRSPRRMLEVLAVSLMYQLVVVASAFEIANAMSLSLSWTVMLAFVPAVAILQVVPVTFGGLGLREGAFILFLRPLGVSTSHAIELGLLVYTINLALSLLGAPAFAMGQRSRQRESIETEVGL